MYHLVGFGEAGQRSYPGQCNPHAWLKSGAIQPATWHPFPRAEIFAPPAPGSPFAHSPPGSVFSEICPQGASSFVRIQNMNTDYGFFHLFKALQSLRSDKTQAALPESRSEVEVTLPKIKYSLLGSQPVQERRCQQRALRWQQFELMNAAAAGRQPIHL